MKTIPHTQPQHGFSTIELLITFAVGIVFLTAAMMVAYSDPTLARQISLDSGQAAALDVALDSSALATSTTNIGYIIEKLSKNWNATIAKVTASGKNPYDVTPTITDIAPCYKEVTNVTGWNVGFGNRSHTMTFGTGLGNLSIAQALGQGGCDPTPLNDWDNPDSFGTFDPTHINGANAGVVASAIDVRPLDGRTYAFLTSLHSSVNVPDFWVIDVTNPDSPTYVSSLDITNGANWPGHQAGANDLVVIGDYAYVLRNHNSNQLQVINISDPSNPTQINPAISFAGVNLNGTDPQGEVIKYYNGRLYIGLHNTQGPELFVYSIIGNPAVPSFVGAIVNGFNHSIYDMVINGSYAYLAIKPGTGGGAQNTKELMVINIAGNTPIDTGNGYNANSGGNDTAGAMSLYLLGNNLYVGREQTNNPRKDFFVFDVANPATPTLLGSANINQTSNSSIQTLFVSDHLAFLGLSKSPEFQILDVSNPSAPTPFGCGDLDFPQEVTDIAYSNNTIFAAVRSNDFLRILKDETSDATCN